MGKAIIGAPPTVAAPAMEMGMVTPAARPLAAMPLAAAAPLANPLVSDICTRLKEDYGLGEELAPYEVPHAALAIVINEEKAGRGPKHFSLAAQAWQAKSHVKLALELHRVIYGDPEIDIRPNKYGKSKAPSASGKAAWSAHF